jgi:uncharacterized RDD family membrane protein YckC
MRAEIPYLPPTDYDSAEPSLEPHPLASASAEKRLTNFIVDFIACAAPFLVIHVAARLAHMPRPRFASGWRGCLLGAAVMLIYFVPQEALWGKTLGKLITRTRVIAVGGGKPGWSRVFVRTLCRLIPFEMFTFIGSYSVGCHDKYSKTRVVVEKSRH